MKPEIRFELYLLERSRNWLHSSVLFFVLMVFPSMVALAFLFPRFEITCFLFACASIAVAWAQWERARTIQKSIDALDP